MGIFSFFGNCKPIFVGVVSCFFCKGIRLPCLISWDLQNSILMEIS